MPTGIRDATHRVDPSKLHVPAKRSREFPGVVFVEDVPPKSSNRTSKHLIGSRRQDWRRKAMDAHPGKWIVWARSNSRGNVFYHKLKDMGYDITTREEDLGDGYRYTAYARRIVPETVIIDPRAEVKPEDLMVEVLLEDGSVQMVSLDMIERALSEAAARI